MIKLKELMSIKDPINEKLRIHLSKDKITSLRDKTSEQPSGAELKPRGLWYGFGRNWINYVYDNQMIAKHGKFIYFVKIKNDNALVKIKTTDDFLSFTQTYKLDTHRYGVWVDWQKVAKDYGGIEINPIRGKHYYDNPPIMWYCHWDVTCGCVWNPDIIELRQIYPKENI